MSEPFIGEIKFAAFPFAPRGYAACNGQQLSVNQNQALFAILGTTYGGNGQTTFALPNLQGRTPMHWGTGAGLPSVALGESAGEINHSLTIAEMPTHNHFVMGSIGGPAQPEAVGAFLPTSGANSYAGTPNTTMVGTEIGNMGGGAGHSNMQPYQVINAIIALQGIFPPRS